ncbi:13928_t:CDS:2 [Dentiscutata heterogama]|uniref:13928_t:CDS:1 n=1 Tax=Dentiscutata heterogama TaxID=1316150 RepID=A0ACA9LEI9_9GLOM|nr:13928_t:CDS:2 [Dentiscutata heterogama]
MSTMEQKHGKESIRALLYFAVMTVFVRASLAGPSLNIPSYETLVEPSEILSALDLSTSDESMSSTTSDKLDLIPHSNKAGIFGTFLASTAALLKGQSTEPLVNGVVSLQDYL